MTNDVDIRTQLKVVVVTVPMRDSTYNTELDAVVLAHAQNPGWWAYDINWPRHARLELGAPITFSVALEPIRQSTPTPSLGQ